MHNEGLGLMAHPGRHGICLTDFGVDMQLKLRQKERLKDRDRLAGTWYAYEPVGGAITIADSSQEQQAPLS